MHGVSPLVSPHVGPHVGPRADMGTRLVVAKISKLMFMHLIMEDHVMYGTDDTGYSCLVDVNVGGWDLIVRRTFGRLQLNGAEGREAGGTPCTQSDYGGERRGGQERVDTAVYVRRGMYENLLCVE